MLPTSIRYMCNYISDVIHCTIILLGEHLGEKEIHDRDIEMLEQSDGTCH